MSVFPGCFFDPEKILFQFFSYEVEVAGIQGGQESFVFPWLQHKIRIAPSLIALTARFHILPVSSDQTTTADGSSSKNTIQPI